MISLALVAILAAAGASTVISQLPQVRLKKAVREYISNMQQTKLDAIKHNGTWQIVFNATNYQIISSGTDRLIDAVDLANPIRTITLADYGSGVAFGSGNATSNWNNNALPAIPPGTALSFSNRGTTNNVTVYLTNQDNAMSYAINTNLAGGKKLYYYSGVTPFNVNNWSED